MKRTIAVFFFLFIFSHSLGAEELKKSIRDQEIEAMSALEKARVSNRMSSEDYAMKRIRILQEFLGMDNLHQMGKEDRKWAFEQQMKQLAIIRQMLSEYKYSIPIIESTEPLADEVLDRAMEYREWKTVACDSYSYDNYSCDMVLRMNRNLAEAAADMKLTVGDYLVKAGAYSKAKKVYREIITTFTGDAYRSYTRKAEFALEDIKGKEDEKPKGKSKKK